ncbi:MAG: TonB-dependent receptor [Sphingomonadales bacterium]
MPKSTLALLTAVSCLSIHPTAAPLAADAITDSIVISATRGQRPQAPLPISTSLLTRDEILSTAATSVDELLRGVPGVQLPPSNSNVNFPANPSVAIRGLGLGDNGTRTLVLIDGVPANGGFFGNVFWNRVPIARVDRIEVVRGGGSSLYGAFAQAGVINILTRAPGETLSGHAELRGGSHGHIGASAAVSGPIGDGLAGGISASLVDADGFFELPRASRGAIDTKSGYRNVALSADLAAAIAKDVKLRLRGNFYDQNQGGISVLSASFTQLWDIAADLDIGLSADSGLRVTAFYQNEDFQTFNPRANADRSAEFASFTSITGSDDAGAAIVYSRQSDGLLRGISLGVDGRLIEGDNDAQTFTPTGGVFLDETNQGTQRAIGLFAEASLWPMPALELLLNIRQDFYRNHNARETENGVSRELPANSFSEFTFRAAGRYQLNETLALRAAGYRAFRAPTLSELYRSFGTSSFQGLANPLLAPETLIGGEAGLTWAPDPATELEITAFYNTVDDFVGGVPVAFFPVFTLETRNLGKMRSQGLELIARRQLGAFLSLEASYSYVDAEVTGNPADPDIIGNRIEGAPRHSASFSLRLDDWAGFSGQLRGRLMSAQFQDVGNETRLGGHGVIDVFVGYQLRAGLSLFLSVENLLDERYRASAFGGLVQRGMPLNAQGGLRLAF